MFSFRMAEQSQVQVFQSTEVFFNEQTFTKQAENFRNFIATIPKDEVKMLHLEAECEYSVGCLSALEKFIKVGNQNPNMITLLVDGCLELAYLIQKAYRKIREMLSEYRCQNKEEQKLKQLVNAVADDPNYDTFSSNKGRCTDISSSGFTSSSSSASQIPSSSTRKWLWKWIKFGASVLAAMVVGGLLGAVTSDCTGVGVVVGFVKGAVEGGLAAASQASQLIPHDL